jgi:hypothetical protein
VQLDGGMSVTTGKFVQSLQNDTAPSAPSIVRNVSGPNWMAFDPATSTGAFVGTGESAFEFGAISQGFIHEPGLVFTSGKVVLSSTVPAQEPAIVTTVPLNGTQVDGCALLGG